MVFKGFARCFGDNITSDNLTPTKYKEYNFTMKDYAEHMMEDIRPGFYSEIKPGDFIVAGTNFGCGSSRESAAAAVREAGMSGVIAKSFNRTFLRNAVSLGLPLFECDTSAIQEGDKLELDTDAGALKTPSGKIKVTSFPSTLLEVVLSGGMLRYFMEHGEFKV